MVDKTRTIINVNRCKCSGKHKRLTYVSYLLQRLKVLIVPNKKDAFEG